MKYKRLKTDSYKVVPVIPLEPLKIEKESKYKQTINELSEMNQPFLDKGRGQKAIIDGETFYRDVPNVSYKLLKRDGKIHQYMTISKGKELQKQLMDALKTDIQSFRMDQTQLELLSENLYAFAIQGRPHHAIELDKDFTSQIKSLFKSVGKNDQLLYSLTVKEIEDHEEKRNELKKRLAGLDPDDVKSVVWHGTKQATMAVAKWCYDGIEDETKEKHRQIVADLKKRGRLKWLFKNSQPMAQRKLAEKNRYMEAEILFLLWTTNKQQAQRFQTKLQRLMDEMQGENDLQVIEVNPDLMRVTKGHLQYDLPHLCLYKKELDKFLYMPSIDEMDDSFYIEHERKTEIPKDMFQPVAGAIPFAREMNTHEMIHFPEAKTDEQKDDAVKPIVLVGEQGGGKTTSAVNQIVETFHLRAKNREEWKKHAHSVFAFEVADGEMHTDVLRHVPEWLMDRVVILNHANLDHPIPTNLHDLAKSTQNVSSLAEDECEMLLDCIDDKSSTIAIERYFKNAMKASYEVGEGGLLDAMRILSEPKYRLSIINRLQTTKKELYIELIQLHRKLEKDEKVIETIENRITSYRTNRTLMHSLAQPPNPNMDFYKWMNGDKDGPYLVLIYIPSETEIGVPARKYFFTHYFYKIWKLMYARSRMNKSNRPETLVVVDELHQILDQRVVQKIFPKIFKEPRKYRLRYLFTFHGWSSMEDAGQKKEPIIQSMMDSGCNIFFYKGGVDFFNSLKRLAEPYKWNDFNEIQKMKYCGLFRVAYNKSSHVFPGRFLEPAADRLEKHREVSLPELYRYQSEFSCPATDVQEMIDRKLEEAYQQVIEDFQKEIKGDEKPCNNSKSMPKPTTLAEDVATITNGSGY